MNKSLATRVLAVAILAVVSWIVLAGAAAPKPQQSDKLVIVSTTDVKGKTSPCG